MKQLICDKLLELMESQHYESIKVTELVKHIGIGRSTFYAHFDSIYSVLQTIEDNFISGLPESYTREDLLYDRKCKVDYFNYLKKNKNIYLTLTGPHGDPSFKVRLANRSRRILLSNVSTPTGKSHSDLERRAVYEFFQGGSDHILTWWLRHDDDISVNEISALTEKLATGIFEQLLSD